jgi:two-component system sensor histidine kinase QseC
MKTIRRQLTRKLLFGFALLIGVGGLGIYFWTRAALQKEFDAELQAKAMAITTLTGEEDGSVEVNFSDRFMRGFDDRVATDFFEMWFTNGAVLERSESLARKSLPHRSGTLKKPQFWNLLLPTGFPGRAVGFNFSPRREEHGDHSVTAANQITLVVASDRRDLDHTLATLALVLGASGLLLLSATVLLVPPVLRAELAPLNYLADQTARITADSLATRFPVEGIPGELMPISSRLNDLLARLEESFERERRFSADLAHELRTPIAELRSMAELALKWPEAREVGTDQETLAIAIQMEGIVSRLLSLLRSERGQFILKTEIIPLASLVENIWEPLAKKALEKKLSVVCDVPHGQQIETDLVLLRSIVANLLDNAVEYSTRGGTVQVVAGMVKGIFTLQVTNTVEDVSRDDLPKFFDRFWRKDAARSDNEHSGLGLSLCRAFALLLGFDLTVTLKDEPLLTLTLSGPASPNGQKPISRSGKVSVS